MKETQEEKNVSKIAGIILNTAIDELLRGGSAPIDAGRLSSALKKYTKIPAIIMATHCAKNGTSYLEEKETAEKLGRLAACMYLKDGKA